VDVTLARVAHRVFAEQRHKIKIPKLRAAFAASAPEIDPHPPAATAVGLSQDTGEAVRKESSGANLYPLDPRIGGRILLGVEMNPIGKSA
jgi:hypothetical protein